MSPPSIIADPDPPKAWIETIQRALRSYNTAATGIVEFYPVVFLVKDSGNNVLGGALARPLYEKLGYKVFGTLENHPKGHSHYFLKKTL